MFYSSEGVERERELNSFVTRTTAADDADAGTVISAVLITKTITLSLLFLCLLLSIWGSAGQGKRERAVSNEQQS